HGAWPTTNSPCVHVPISTMSASRTDWRSGAPTRERLVIVQCSCWSLEPISSAAFHVLPVRLSTSSAAFTTEIQARPTAGRPVPPAITRRPAPPSVPGDIFIVVQMCASTIGVDEALDLAELFRLLGDPNRIRILYALAAADELCVHELAEAVDASETK